MDVAVRASVRKSIAVALAVLLLGVGYLLHGGGRSSVPTKLTASDLLLAASTAKAGIYLQYDGLTDKPGVNHTHYIPLSSFEFGVARPAQISGGSRTLGKVSVSEITVGHQTDQYSVPLLNEALRGSGAGDAVVYFSNLNVGGKLVDYLEFDLSNVLVTNFSLSSGGEVPSESFSLNSTAITLTAHIAGSPEQTVSYDIIGGN